MTDRFISVAVAPYHSDRLPKPTKAALREMLKAHPDTDFFVYSIDKGSYTTVEGAARHGVEELAVLSSDKMKIIGVIVPRLTEGEGGATRVEMVVK